MMVVMLIMSIIMAAMAPVMTRRMQAAAKESNSPWNWVGNNFIDAHFGSENSKAIIGKNAADAGDIARLIISTSNTVPTHILFERGNTNVGILNFADNGGLQLGNNTTVGTRGIAIGNTSNVANEVKAEGLESVAIGANTSSNGNHSVAMSFNTKATGRYSVSIGAGSRAGADTDAADAEIRAVALGAFASASKAYSTALGASSKAEGANSIAIGQVANANGQDSVAIGMGTKSTGDYSISIGRRDVREAYDTYGATGGSAVSVGNTNKASGASSIAIGTFSQAIGNGSVAISYGSIAGKEQTPDETPWMNAIAIGTNSQATELSSTALGAGAQASGASSIAIGESAKATATNSLAIGMPNGTTLSTEASGVDSTAIGNSAIADAAFAISIGSTTKASGNNSIAIGNAAKAVGENNIAIGHNACLNVKGSNKVCIGASSGPTDGHPWASSTDTTERIFIGSQSQFNEGPAVLEVHNDATKITRFTHFTNGKDVPMSKTGVVINGNLIVKGAIFTSTMEEDDGGQVKSERRRIVTFGTNPSSSQYARVIGLDSGFADHFTGYKNSTHPNGYFASPSGGKYDGEWSDRRLKYVGTESKSGLDKIRQLKVFNYTFKKDEKKTPHVGVIAQDLQKIFPDAVTKDDNGFLRIRMEDMFYAVINAIKELDAIVKHHTEVLAEVSRLKAENKELRKILQQVQDDNKRQEARLKALEAKIK